MENKKKLGVRYEWVPVEEDFPPDDPEIPYCSIEVRVKVAYDKSCAYPMAYYDYRFNDWLTVSQGRVLKGTVIAWTNDY